MKWPWSKKPKQHEHRWKVLRVQAVSVPQVDHYFPQHCTEAYLQCNACYVLRLNTVRGHWTAAELQEHADASAGVWGGWYNV